MPGTAFEADLKGKRQSLSNKIANIESTACPYTSMIKKRERPTQLTHTWQVEAYPDAPFGGVMQGRDATDFQSVGRAELSCKAQKLWRLPAVEDLVDEVEVAGVSTESAHQIAVALVLLKRMQEQVCLSNSDTANEALPGQPNETRGAFSWFANTAQSYLPVPEAFRTPAASRYTSTIAAFTEAAFLGLARSSYIQRKGPFKMDAFLGITLKAEFTNFTKYVDTVSNKTAVRSFNQTGNSYVLTVDKLVLDTGEIDLHPSSFLLKAKATGADTASTHRSGFICDMEMMGLAYTRLPRVKPLPYLGGSNKWIVDTVLLHMCDNPLGAIVLEIAS